MLFSCFLVESLEFNASNEKYDRVQKYLSILVHYFYDYFYFYSCSWAMMNIFTYESISEISLSVPLGNHFKQKTCVEYKCSKDTLHWSDELVILFSLLDH